MTLFDLTAYLFHGITSSKISAESKILSNALLTLESRWHEPNDVEEEKFHCWRLESISAYLINFLFVHVLEILTDGDQLNDYDGRLIPLQLNMVLKHFQGHIKILLESNFCQIKFGTISFWGIYFMRTLSDRRRWICSSLSSTILRLKILKLLLMCWKFVRFMRLNMRIIE